MTEPLFYAQERAEMRGMMRSLYLTRQERAKKHKPWTLWFRFKKFYDGLKVLVKDFFIPPMLAPYMLTVSEETRVLTDMYRQGLVTLQDINKYECGESEATTKILHIHEDMLRAKHQDEYKKVLYVALSRPRTYLCVVCTSPWHDSVRQLFSDSQG